ncbi:hypothetical protein CLH62_05125 [Marinobacter guineae]|uniref:Uncharacterized protein n=1 Tax=Marinobacter guineae TaxID=432303 RepID=A0A2G1VJN8_9GAMM|nr:hypothetical protein [Marinobacter guineae]PHQ26968.1 hypothetical protein CLH62_05125 [Marinobacter guineae]
MDTDALWRMLSSVNLPLFVSAGAFLLALISLSLISGARRRNQDQLANLREKCDTLWRELDDIRVAQFNRPGSAGSAGASSPFEEASYHTEMQAYSKIWPQVWQLYERLGTFLRAVEAGEAAGELRLESRNAALEARNLLNRNRPFCSQSVDELVTRLIDAEIKAHLAACQYLDLLKDVSSASSGHDRRVLQDKCHSLHEGEARDLMNQLAASIRQRAIRAS